MLVYLRFFDLHQDGKGGKKNKELRLFESEKLRFGPPSNCLARALPATLAFFPSNLSQSQSWPGAWLHILRSLVLAFLLHLL